LKDKAKTTNKHLTDQINKHAKRKGKEQVLNKGTGANNCSRQYGC
jgi:hypothetical protein